MFDFHMHSRLSYDCQTAPETMVRAAERRGLREICFTDHLDYDPLGRPGKLTFDTADYNAAYDGLESQTVTIRRGFEFGMLANNAAQLKADAARRDFDFIIGSVHFARGEDIYFPPYWQGRDAFQGERDYLEDALDCVRVHEDYDVLGHLTYVGKVPAHPSPRPMPMGDHRELVDAILKLLVQKGKGLEVNTSGMDACGAFLPTADYLRRFRELGGEIVTLGSDAHTPERVGQYADRALEMLRDVFGYVCTFAERRPIFHKL